MYNVDTIIKALGKRRMAKVWEFDAYTVGNFTYGGMCFDIIMKYGWSYDGGETGIVFEARPEEYTQAQVISVLKNEIDRFEFDGMQAILEAALDEY